MNLKLYHSIPIMLLMALNLTAVGQFTKKMELDIYGGIHNVASKEITVADIATYDLGNQINPHFGLDLWYNLNQKYSVGLNLGASLYSPDIQSGLEEENFPVSESLHFMIGLGGKYHFVNHKKFKAFVKANLQFTSHIVDDKQYYIVQSGDYPYTQTLKYNFDDDGQEPTFGLGGQLNIGMKTYFSNSFGMLFEAGYLNNGYYKGVTATGGFFFDLGTN